jgi:hypothetical protein
MRSRVPRAHERRRGCKGAHVDPASLTIFLAPFLSALIQGAVGEAAQDMGQDAWRFAKALWAKLRPSVEAKESAIEAARDVAGDPFDQRALGAFEIQLQKLLSADPQLAAAVEQLWRQAESANVVVVGARGVGIVGNVSGANIVTGDGNTIQG